MGLVSAYFPGVRCVHIIKVPGTPYCMRVCVCAHACVRVCVCARAHACACVCARAQSSLHWGGMHSARLQRRPFVPLHLKCAFFISSVFRLIFETGLSSHSHMHFGKWPFVKLSAMGKLKKNEDAFSVDVCSGIFIRPMQFPWPVQARAIGSVSFH